MAEVAREYKDRLFCFIFGSEAHKDWTLSLYNAVNGSSYTYLEANRAEVKTMLLTEYNEAETMQLFKEEGRAEGRSEGLDILGALITKLKSLGRVNDVFRAAADPAYRDRLLAEFNMG